MGGLNSGITRLRNHDLLTSLDVLTTGSYRRLPSAIQVKLCHHWHLLHAHISDCRRPLFLRHPCPTKRCLKPSLTSRTSFASA